MEGAQPANRASSQGVPACWRAAGRGLHAAAWRLLHGACCGASVAAPLTPATAAAAAAACPRVQRPLGLHVDTELPAGVNWAGSLRTPGGSMRTPHTSKPLAASHLNGSPGAEQPAAHRLAHERTPHGSSGSSSLGRHHQQLLRSPQDSSPGDASSAAGDCSSSALQSPAAADAAGSPRRHEPKGGSRGSSSRRLRQLRSASSVRMHRPVSMVVAATEHAGELAVHAAAAEQ